MYVLEIVPWKYLNEGVSNACLCKSKKIGGLKIIVQCYETSRGGQSTAGTQRCP